MSFIAGGRNGQRPIYRDCHSVGNSGLVTGSAKVLSIGSARGEYRSRNGWPDTPCTHHEEDHHRSVRFRAHARPAGRPASLRFSLESVPRVYRGPAPATLKACQLNFNYDRTIPNRWIVVTSLLAIKALAALAILVVGLLGGAIPILATRHHASHRILSLSNALAGGIFLGAGFLHLLPEASEALGDVIEYPLAPLMAAIAVCTLLLIDRVLIEALQAGTRRQGEKAHEPIYPVVLLVVLSIHSVTAGIALGIEAELAASLLVMIAILCHKGSAAFALVVSLIAAGTANSRVWRALGVFVAMTPLGIVIGTGASSLLEGQEATLIEGGFSALAAGTFIYVAILAVISAERSRIDDHRAHYLRSDLVGHDDAPMPERDSDRAFKFLLVVIGLGCMAVLRLWV